MYHRDSIDDCEQPAVFYVITVAYGNEHLNVLICELKELIYLSRIIPADLAHKQAKFGKQRNIVDKRRIRARKAGTLRQGVRAYYGLNRPVSSARDVDNHTEKRNTKDEGERLNDHRSKLRTHHTPPI